MINKAIPILPLRDIVVFPHMVAPLFVGRKPSINALNTVMTNDKKILLVTQKNSEVDNPNSQDLYKFGTIKISLTNTSILELSDENNRNKIVNTDFETHFQLIMKDKLPIYMENLIGLMIKKIFYNLKVFIDNLNI